MQVCRIKALIVDTFCSKPRRLLQMISTVALTPKNTGCYCYGGFLLLVYRRQLFLKFLLLNRLLYVYTEIKGKKKNKQQHL